MLDHGPHPPRSREKKRNPWRQHVHRATRPRSYAIDKVWEAVTSRCLGNGRSDGSYKQYGGVKSIICYLCIMQHAWSCYFFLTMAQQPLLGQGLLIIEDPWSHSDTPHSVGLVWTSDQPKAETSTWRHTTITRDRLPCPREIRTHNPSKRAAAEPRLRPRGQWDRQFYFLPTVIYTFELIF